MRNQEYKVDFSSVTYKNCSAELTSLKKDEEFAWLNQVDSTALQSSLKNLDSSFKNFFEGRSKYPRFHSRKSGKFTYTSKCTNHNIEILKNHIKLPKVGCVKTKVSRVFEGKILSATISRTPDGKYYAAIAFEIAAPEKFAPTGAIAGIDLGIKKYLTLANTEDRFGLSVDNPKFLDKDIKKLKSLQRKLSRKTKDSNNYNKTKLQISKLHRKITNRRNDFLHKLSLKLVQEYQVICIEDLDVKGMLHAKKMSRYISDAGWSTFITYLKYKASWYGSSVIEVERYFKSSQTCSKCGYINKDVKDLNVRTWICPECGKPHDRDYNAAVNILNEGIRIYQSI